MTIRLMMPRETRSVTVPFPHAEYAVVEGTCPNCKYTPFKVQGVCRRIASDDQAYESDGYCTGCKRPVGTLRAEVSTIFGLRADEQVLSGPWKVY